MNMRRSVFLIALACAGCASPRVWVTVQPQFDYRKIRMLAVVPFDNASEHPEAGRVMAEKLAALLASKGPYQVLAGDRLGAVAGGDSAAVIAQCRAAGADAVLGGSVEHYTADLSHDVRYYYGPFEMIDEPQQVTNYEEVPTDWYKIDAMVKAGIRLTDLPSGEVIWRDERLGTSSSYGSPPPLDEPQVLDQAADAAARKLLLGLVPHQERERVPPGGKNPG